MIGHLLHVKVMLVTHTYIMPKQRKKRVQNGKMISLDTLTTSPLEKVFVELTCVGLIYVMREMFL